MKKTIDITNPDDFREAGFKDCDKCGWSFDSEHFLTHDCWEWQEATKRADRGENIEPKNK